VRRRIAVALATALAGVALVGGALVLAGGDDGGDGGAARPGAPPAPDLAGCRPLGGEAARQCFERAFTALVQGRDDPRPAVQAIAESAWKEGPSLVANCHGIMHAVGRGYARDAGVTLATLMDHLPQTNDPGCSAGFAHGMVTAIAPAIDTAQPGDAAQVCDGAHTRYQRYSCVHGFGHAFMRVYGDELDPALDLCLSLGPAAAADCAQGAYHDHWFAVLGADDATAPADAVRDPRRLCGDAPASFVRACWYRAWIENRPETFEVAAPEDLHALCDGLRGVQREGCIAGASVIGPTDPAEQLALCARLRDPADAGSCARGTKVQNLLGDPAADFVALVDRCSRFAPAARDACARWLGRAIAVLTDGAFARDGCPRVRAARARRACAEGAADLDAALETFS
jgi:hypothetical protein